MAKTDAATKAVGADLTSVLPNDGLPWYKKPHLVKLHLCVFSLILFGMLEMSESPMEQMGSKKPLIDRP
jgi:hypothetical protein